MIATDVIVLVGGLGTRLRATVPNVPKPLAPVAGRPFLGYLLDGYARAGMRRIILATGHGGAQVHEAIGDSWAGMEVVYSDEPAPLGTGGAIRRATSLAGGHGVHLANGDTYLVYQPGRLELATAAKDALLGMALAHVDDVARYGAVEVEDGLVTGFVEKGVGGDGWINAGSYFLTEAGIAALPGELAFSFEDRVLRPWARDGRVSGDGLTSDFIDIGVPEDYLRAQGLFARVGA